MATKYHVRKRAFLNRDKEMPAYIIGIVEDTSRYPDSEDNSWENGKIDLKIADCYRRVSFDFYMDSPQARADSLFKIRQLAEVINAVKEAIEQEAESISNRKHTK